MVHVRLPPDGSRVYGRQHVPPSAGGAARGGPFGWGGLNSPGPRNNNNYDMGGDIGGGMGGAQLKMQAYEVDTQFYNYGITLMADSSRSEESDSVLVVSPDLNQTLIRSDVGL
jgi:hypothetical protein